MKNWISRCFFATGLLTFASCTPIGETRVSNALPLDIVRDAKPVARIVMPDTPDPAVKQSALWIQKYVKEGTGAELPIVAESKDEGTGTRICVGATEAARKAGISGDSLKWDACRIVVKGDTLFLLGHDDPGVPTDPWIAPKGTCRAAVTFLEDFCGVRWFISYKRPQGEFVPLRKDISVPSDLDQSITPVFMYATGSCYGDGNNTPGAYANNYRVAVRKWFRAMTCHTWAVWVPASKYYKEHPEYFALINGKRSDAENSNLCTSNPEVKRLMLEGLRNVFDQGYDLVPLAQADGAVCCKCPDCQKKYGAFENFDKPNSFDNPCERIQMFHRELAEECMKTHPDKKVQILLYDQTRFPSKQFDKYPDNVVLELCEQDPPDPRILASWKGKAKSMTTYVYWWGIYHAPALAPKFTASQVADTLRYFRDNNIEGILIDGIGECWGLEGHSYYAAGKLLGNPDLDPKKLIKEYCIGVYGPFAGPVMNYFFEVLDGRVEFFKKALVKDPKMNNTETVYDTLYPPSVVKQLDSILSQAEKAAKDDRSRMWLTYTRQTFENVKLTANVYSLYRAFQVNDNLANLEQLQKAVEEWRSYRDKILAMNYKPTKDDIGFPGWYFWKIQFSTGGYMKGAIRGPFLWDFEKMKVKYANGTHPFVAPKLVATRTAKPPLIDGVISEDEWKMSSPVDLGLMSSGPADVSTKLRAAFDDKNLYLVFTCAEPNIDKLKLAELPRDGAVWGLDCVEMFFAPELPAKYMHLIAAPKAGAFYDDRVGYISDPIHPKFGKQDATWNPDWKYAFQINTDKREWTLEVEIPFSSLEAPTPQAGTEWRANFGRERYAGQKDSSPGLYLWSPNMIGNKFCEPLCFGSMYFEKDDVAPSK